MSEVECACPLDTSHVSKCPVGRIVGAVHVGVRVSTVPQVLFSDSSVDLMWSVQSVDVTVPASCRVRSLS